MGYSPSKYGNVDLTLKPVISPSKNADRFVLYIQQALNDLGSTSKDGRPLDRDGVFGAKTKESMLKFQEACNIPRTGIFDFATQYQLDWRVYLGWSPCPSNITNIKPGGPAIVNGKNELTGLPVNSIGLIREAQRLSDVGEAFIGRPLGYEGAVRRNAVGTSTPSRHWFGFAGDDLADQDKDRKHSADELMLMRSLRDMYFARAQGFKPVAVKIPYTMPDGTKKVLEDSYMGFDHLATMVCGNVKMPDDSLMFPGLRANRDASWDAARNTYKGLSATVHVKPLHLHTDCLPGAPFGSPFS